MERSGFFMDLLWAVSAVVVLAIALVAAQVMVTGTATTPQSVVAFDGQ